MQLKIGLGASYTIRPGNTVGLFYSSQTHWSSVHSVYAEHTLSRLQNAQQSSSGKKYTIISGLPDLQYIFNIHIY